MDIMAFYPLKYKRRLMVILFRVFPVQEVNLMKKFVALMLCLFTVLTVFASCAMDEDDKGAIVNMYLFNEVRCFDPLYAYSNGVSVEYDTTDAVFQKRIYANAESAELLGLLYDGLFKLESNGKVKKNLCKSYYVDERTDDEGVTTYKMIITLNDTRWSDGTPVQANDFIFTVKRILDPNISCDAAPLLFDIKNAKKVKSGDISRDRLGISAPDPYTIEIEFEENHDYDQFLENLASPMLVPLRENKVNKPLTDEKGELIYGNDGQPALSTDWSSTATSLVCSGPFFIRKIDSALDQEMVLERNKYYYTNPEREERVDKYVTPYRIIVHFDFTLDQVLEAYNNGTLFYVGALTKEAFAQYENQLNIKDELSTGCYMFNTGKELFQNPAVRRALSLALDRNTMAGFITASLPATGLVPKAAYDTKHGTSYRDHYGDAIKTEADIAAAKEALKSAGVSGGEIKILVRNFTKNDEKGMAEYAKAQWEQLGFSVTVDERGRNRFQAIFDSGDYDVIYTDWQTYTVRPFSVLAPFSINYSGTALDTEHNDYDPKPNVTGYSNPEYDKLIAEAESFKEGSRERNDKLFEAEKLLMQDMPIIPLVFWRDYYMTGRQISNVKDTGYAYRNLTKMKLSNYKDYITTAAEE